MKEWFAIIGGIILLGLGLFGMFHYLDGRDKAEGTETCKQYGGSHVRIRGHLLCVDPKTRLVYLPE